MTYRVPKNPVYKVLKHIPVLSPRRWPDPSSEDVRLLWAAMAAKYNVQIIDKDNASEMQMVADSVDALGILDKEHFLDDYVTTIGDKIYAPFTPGIAVGAWDLWQQTMVIGHEIVHVSQDRAKEGILFELEYSTNSTKRAYYESEAYRVQMTLSWCFRREILNSTVMAGMLADYACNMDDISMVEKILKMSLISIQKGAVPHPVCQWQKQWLEARWS